MDLDHIDESLWTCKPSHLNNYGLTFLYREMLNLCCACAETCHNRNPNSSYRRKNSLRKSTNALETDVDDTYNDDGGSGGGGACKRARLDRTCKDPRLVYSGNSQSCESGTESD